MDFDDVEIMSIEELTKWNTLSVIHQEKETVCKRCNETDKILNTSMLTMDKMKHLVDYCQCPRGDKNQKDLADLILFKVERLPMLLGGPFIRGEIDYEQRSKICATLLNNGKGGRVYEMLNKELQRCIEKWSIKSTSINRILSYYTLFFPYTIVRCGEEDLIILELPEKKEEGEVIVKDQVEEVSFRSQARLCAQSYQSNLEIRKKDDITEIQILDKKEICPSSKMIEDDTIQLMMLQVEEERRIPFKLGVEGPFVQQEIRTYEKTYEYPLVVYDLPEKVSIIDYKDKVDVEVVIEEKVRPVSFAIGDGNVMKCLKISPQVKDRRQIHKIQTKEGHFYYSTDNSAVRKITGQDVEIEHNKDAEIINLKEELFSLLDFPQSVIPSMKKYGGYEQKGPLQLFNFLRSLLLRRSRRKCELDFFLSVTFPRRPKALGKYLKTIGAIRNGQQDRVRWHWGYPTPFYLGALYLLVNGMYEEGAQILEDLNILDVAGLLKGVFSNVFFFPWKEEADYVLKIYKSKWKEDWIGSLYLYPDLQWDKGEGITSEELFRRIRLTLIARVERERVEYYLSRSVRAGVLRKEIRNEILYYYHVT